MKAIRFQASALSLAILFSFCASAQDIIVKKDGTIVKATVTKVSETEVEYKNFGSTSERIYSLGTASILSINYEDGTVDKFSVQEQDIQAQDVHGQIVQKPKNIKVVPDTEANEAVIKAVNSSVVSYDKNKPGKKAYSAILKFAVSPRSVLVSDELSVSAESGRYYKYDKVERYDSYCDMFNKKELISWGNPAIKFHVTNRTDHTLYLDLGNTFLSIGGQTIPYYVPGAQSTTSTSGKGVGVNLGAVAGALGVGGAVGALANGVTVGGGNSTSSNDIVYNQRVIAVAPFSRVSLDFKIIEDGNIIFTKKGCSFANIFYPEPIMQDEKIEFSEENSPLKLRFFLAYSATEDCNRLKNMEAEFYGQYIYGWWDGWSSVKDFRISKEAIVVISTLTTKR